MPAFSKDQPRQQGGAHVNQPQPDAHPHAAEHTRAQDADQKHRIGVVAEGQKPLGLFPGQQTVPVKPGGSLGTDGVSAHQPQQQGGTGAAGQAEQRRHASGQVRGNPRPKPQRDQQSGNHHEGKHGWNHRSGTQLQCLCRRAADPVRVRQKPDQQTAQNQEVSVRPRTFMFTPAFRAMLYRRRYA